MRSYRPEELFDDEGALKPEIAALAPEGTRRMSANPHANGGLLMRELELPEIARYAVKLEAPGATETGSVGVMAAYLRDVMRDSAKTRNFRVFGPDETNSNRLGRVFEATERAWQAEICPRTITSRPAGE